MPRGFGRSTLGLLVVALIALAACGQASPAAMGSSPTPVGPPSLSVAEAQHRVSFHLMVPTVLPTGYTLTGAAMWPSSAPPPEQGVELLYQTHQPTGSAGFGAPITVLEGPKGFVRPLTPTAGLATPPGQSCTWVTIQATSVWCCTSTGPNQHVVHNYWWTGGKLTFFLGTALGGPVAEASIERTIASLIVQVRP